MNLPKTYRQWVLAKPLLQGTALTAGHFALRELLIPPLEEGQALVRIRLINIHAATRTRIAGTTPNVGETDRSNYACAEVLSSRDPSFRPGDIIACQAGWQDHQVISSQDRSVGYNEPSELVEALNGTRSQWNYVFRPAMTKMWPPDVLMDIFGTSGMTAYFGMRECGPLMPTDAVAVAGAGGSVGSLAAQLAKKAGCYVVGFAGGEERCRWVEEKVGVDRCLNYRSDSFEDDLRAAFPNGIDVFSDGIGGAFTEVIARTMNRHSRLFAYGSAASFYEEGFADEKAAGTIMQNLTRPTTLRQALVNEEAERIVAAKRIKVEAWIVYDFYAERLNAEDDLTRLLRSGAIRPINKVVKGFEKLPEAISSLYQGNRVGKLQVLFDP